jgi:hypothetical protein
MYVTEETICKATSSKATSSKASKSSKQNKQKQQSKQQQSKTHADPMDNNPAAAGADHAAAAAAAAATSLPFVCYGGLGVDPIDKPAAAAEADMTDHGADHGTDHAAAEADTTDHAHTDDAVKTNHAAAPPPLFVPLPFYFTRSPGGSDLFGVW